jgi:hypothetical protein
VANHQRKEILSNGEPREFRIHVKTPLPRQIQHFCRVRSMLKWASISEELHCLCFERSQNGWHHCSAFGGGMLSCYLTAESSEECDRIEQIRVVLDAFKQSAGRSQSFI